MKSIKTKLKLLDKPEIVDSVDTASSQTTLDRESTLDLLKGFLLQFQYCCNQKQPPSETKFKKFISRNIKNSSNGHVIGKGLGDFLMRIKRVQEKYSHLEIIPSQELFIFENKVLVQYTIEATLVGGRKTSLFVMALATINNGLITEWEQVAHDKGADHLTA